MLVLLRFVFGSAGASGFLGFSVDFRRAALARASSAVLRVCYRWSCPPISPNSPASALSCVCDYLRRRTCVAAPAMPHARCFAWIELSRRVDNGHRLSISTKGVSRAGGYARAPAACAPSCVLLPALPRAHTRTRAHWRPAAIAGHPAAARVGSPVCSTWLVSRFRASRLLGAT